VYKLYLAAGAAVLCALGSSLSRAAPPEAEADALVARFVYESLALAPVTASQAGYPVHDGLRLEDKWDDYSVAGRERVRQFNRQLGRDLDTLETATLDPERAADLRIVRNNVGLNLLELDTVQGYRHNPTIYVELIGNGLYTPYVQYYAPAALRFRDVISRLRGLPMLVEQAKLNLADSPEVWNRVAHEENDGNISLIDKTLRAATPVELRAEFAAAAAPALQAPRDLNEYLATTLSKKTSDWRLGKDNYQRKCSYVLATGRTAAQLLSAAEADLAVTRAEMARLTAPRSVAQALADIARQHATPDSYMAEAKHALAQATEFVRQKDLVTLPTSGNLAVIETPMFMRGTYAVGGFSSAPALQPQLEAFYWVTPLPKDWPQERIDSKLREYNRYGMQQLTIHEAMPGHYLQGEFAHRVQPPVRRVLRDVWGSGPYVEGWALYAQQMLTDEGYLNGDPALRLTLLKQMLRSEANTILDIRLQTLGMTEQQALDLMTKQTYQEREEASAKLQRAQLSSCQLAMYYAGFKGWSDIRAHYQQRLGPKFSLREFHDRALNEGAVPLSTLDRLLTQ
jgi:uncharacterized protein (DUF885 family)